MSKVRNRSNRIGGKSIGVHLSFRLGTRRNGISAHRLSTKDLLAEYFEPKLKKNKQKVIHALRCRGITDPDGILLQDEKITE